MEVDAPFVRARTTDVTLRDGGVVRIRPIVPADKGRLQDGLAKLSAESRYHRFLAPLRELSPRDLAYLTEIDYRDHFAAGALALDEPGEPGIGVARYVRLADGDVAEAAVAVTDEHQRRGLGRLLLEAMCAVALENGIRSFRAYALAENRSALRLLDRMGWRRELDSPGVVRVDLDLPSHAATVEDSPLYEMLRAVARGEAPPPAA